MNNSYITIIKEERTDLSRKRVPLNQNECTANFRTSVPFEQNLHYIGEDAEKLTDHYEIEETNDENDTYIASLSDSNMYVGNQQGKYSYIYSGRKLSEYNLDQNEIYMMIWGYDASSEEEVKNIKEALISSYGDYDDKIIYSGGNNTNFNLKYGESITNYKWEKTHKFDIYFSVFKEGDEVKATVIGWLKHDIKNMTLDDYLNFFF